MKNKPTLSKLMINVKILIKKVIFNQRIRKKKTLYLFLFLENCIFGNQIFEIGDSFEIIDDYVCECLIPPLTVCIK